MKKLILIGAALGLFLTSCNKKEHCEKEWEKKEFCKGGEHEYEGKEDWNDDKDIDSDWDKEGEWEDNEGYDKEDKNWWWKKKKGYDKDDCDDVYPEKDYDKENQLKDSDQ